MSDVIERVEECGECRYWRRTKDGEGICCRRSPVLTHIPVMQGGARLEVINASGWPVTRPDQWCGEWEWGLARPVEAPKDGVKKAGLLLPMAGGGSVRRR